MCVRIFQYFLYCLDGAIVTVRQRERASSPSPWLYSISESNMRTKWEKREWAQVRNLGSRKTRYSRHSFTVKPTNESSRILLRLNVALTVFLSIDNFRHADEGTKIYVSKLVAGRGRKMPLSSKFEFRPPRSGWVCWPWAFCVKLFWNLSGKGRRDSLNISGGSETKGFVGCVKEYTHIWLKKSHLFPDKLHTDRLKVCRFYWALPRQGQAKQVSKSKDKFHQTTCSLLADLGSTGSFIIIRCVTGHSGSIELVQPGV